MSEASNGAGNTGTAQPSNSPQSAATNGREKVADTPRDNPSRDSVEHHPLSADFKARVIAEFERSRKGSIPAEARELSSARSISVQEATDRVLTERIVTRATAYMDVEVEKRQPLRSANPPASVNASLEQARIPLTDVIDKDLARQWAIADARELRRIVDSRAREDAGAEIADNMRRNSDYAAYMNTRQKDVAAIAHEAARATELRSIERMIAKGAHLKVENSIADVSDKTPVRVTYSVGSPGKAQSTYQDPQVAAQAFADLNAERRPLVVRTVRDQEGKEWSATVAGTGVVDPEGRRQYVKTVSAQLDPEFAAAYLEVTRENKQDVSRSNNGIERDQKQTTSINVDAASEKEAAALTRMTSAAKEIEKRLIDEHFHRRGKDYRFNENSDVVAFSTERTARGTLIKTDHNDNALVVKGMVDLAVEKGWRAIEVNGTQEFKQQVWLEATARGRAVKGYEPNIDDLAKLRDRLERDQPLSNTIAASPIPKQGEPPVSHQQQTYQRKEADTVKRPDLSGQVVDLGRAPYKHLPDEPTNYYIRLRDKAGNETTVWGKDLERAVGESQLKVGDQVQSIRQRGREPVTVVSNVRDQDNAVVGRETKATHLNRWEIQKDEAVSPTLTPIQAGLVRVVTERAPVDVREQVARHATERLVEMERHGVQPKVEIYDAGARSSLMREARATPMPTRERSLNR